MLNTPSPYLQDPEKIKRVVAGLAAGSEGNKENSTPPTDKPNFENSEIGCRSNKKTNCTVVSKAYLRIFVRACVRILLD